MTTEPKSATRHFTTEAFGPRERVAACHDVYGRAFAKIDLDVPSDGELKIEAKLRNLPGLALVSTMSTEFRFHKPARMIDHDDTRDAAVTVPSEKAKCSTSCTRSLPSGEPGRRSMICRSPLANWST